MSADALEAMAAAATLALRASFAPSRHCQACGGELPYLGGRGRPRRWCDAHHPRPSRLRSWADGAPGCAPSPTADPFHVRRRARPLAHGAP